MWGSAVSCAVILFYFYFISFAIKTAYSYNTIIMRRKKEKKGTQYNGRVSATATPITAGQLHICALYYGKIWVHMAEP